MLDKIQNNTSDIIEKSQIDRISQYGATNPFKEATNDYFIDESHISFAAMDKYQREIDIKEFSKILLETDEKEANNLVINQAFDGDYSIENDDFLLELINNENFLNDINKEDI